MSEESILILNMLREGKVSAEQADSLLRAVRETAPPPPSIPPIPPVPPAPDPSALQGKLGDLQHKLGELQGKLGAAAAGRMAESAAAMAGKMADKIPKADIEVNVHKIIDEAMRGLHSFKHEAMRTAREAGRQARDEARKAGREGRRAMKFDFNFDFKFPGEGGDSARPDNRDGLPEAADVAESDHTWTGMVGLMLLHNPFGRVDVRGGRGINEGAAHFRLTKRAWAETEAEARVLLQQVFVTAGVEEGKFVARIVAPADARERVLVDWEVYVAPSARVQVETTHGDVSAEGVSSALTVQTHSGKIAARALTGEASGDARLVSRSGKIELDGWNDSVHMLVIETQSGDIQTKAITAGNLRVVTRSGDLALHQIQVSHAATVESASGDVHLEGGGAEERLTLKTQSGGAEVIDFRAAQLQIETASGDLMLRETAGALSVKTVSGDIHAEAVHSPAVSLGTVSGDARLSFAAPFSGSLAGTTVSGDLTVALWTNSDTRVEMNTLSGDLACALPLDDPSPGSDKHLAGKIGDGTGSVKLQSVSGDLHVSAQS